MRAALDHFTMVDDQDLVGVADSAQPVGDDEAGAARHQTQHGCLDLFLRARVDAAGHLVQDQDARIGQQLPKADVAFLTYLKQAMISSITSRSAAKQSSHRHQVRDYVKPLAGLNRQAAMAEI